MMPRRKQELPGLTTEWTKSGSFINKPVRGWLHPDQLITGEGMCYGVRYIGCIEINTSMKSLDFDTRSVVAKECICRICEAAGFKSPDKRRRVDKKISDMLADSPNMDYAGSNVNMVITSFHLNLTVLETRKVIASHEMPNVSFASGGEADTLDFVAYVAKDHKHGRACFVLECGVGLAQDVIATIGQAFELRFKQFLCRTPLSINPPPVSQNHGNRTSVATISADPDYYNDLPGKIPPESLSNTLVTTNHQSNTSFRQCLDSLPSTSDLNSGNLIDLGTEISTTFPKALEPEYVNTMVGSNVLEPSKDPFDMQPFEETLPMPRAIPPPPPHHRKATTPVTTTRSIKNTLANDGTRAVLESEIWFHGTISRKDSELLVIRDGDFLVRESPGSPGQYVLTGMQNGVRKHLLLVDPEGIVRTKDRTFESVSHLVNYHCDNGLPIISAESALVLRNPVHKASAF